MLTRARRWLFIAIAAAAAVLAPSGSPLGFLPGWAPRGRTAAEVPTSTATAVPRGLCGGRSGSCSRRHRGGLGRAAYKVTIHTVSKPENKGWEAAAVDEYSKRLATAALPINVETIFHKADSQLLRAVERTDHPIVVLDERGAELTSEGFAELLFSRLEAGGSRISFVIGGADGLPRELRQDLKPRGSSGQGPRTELMSLGLLTLPHKLARAILVEQLYRASEIRRGSKYHRGDPYAD